MKRGDLVDFLRPATGLCFGAVFTSYDFDEVFFESVLATLLPIHADPDTDPHRFVDEGRRRLRETPVLVMIDGYRPRGGHRLPFDLLRAPPDVAFHPKLALTLYEDHARLMVGSANLTEGGYGGNAELVAQLVLDYRADRGLIDDVCALVAAAGAKGEAWERLRAQLSLLGRRSGRARGHAARLLCSTRGTSVVEQLVASLPKKARIAGVSLLLGAQPEDDHSSDSKILDGLLDGLEKRQKKLPTIELGLPWEGNPVAPPPEPQPVVVEDLIGKLCARLEGEPASVRYLVPLRIEGKDVVCDAGAETVTIGKRELKAELAASPPRLWPLEELTAIAPVEAIDRLLERAPARFFVFPELRLEHGRVFRRALHAKLIAVRTIEGSAERTHLVVGAPCFERQSNAANTLIDAALYEVHPGHLTLQSLAPELAPAPVDQLYMQNRPVPASAPAERSPLQDAIYDAETRTLSLAFAPGASSVSVVYQTIDDELEIVSGSPHLHHQLPSFPLDHHSSELRVDVGEQSWLVPIAFRHLPRLRCEEPEETLAFWPFVHLLSGRVDVDARQATSDTELPLDRASAQRVFRAVAVLADGLAAGGPSLGAFEVALDGPTGLRRFAARWLEEVQDDSLGKDESWLYGEELARTLAAINFGRGAAAEHKRGVIDALLVDLRARLDKLAPRAPYVKGLRRLYRDGR